MPFQYICETCGDSFSRPTRSTKRTPYRFCSKSCRYWVPSGIYQDDGSVLVPLDNSVYAIVDGADAERVLAYRWRLDAYGYAVRSVRKGEGKRGQTIKMHSWLVGTVDGLEPDHIDRDKLNNRRGNLRLATHAENNRNEGIRATNTSGFKGVSWHQRRSCWRAYIRVDYRQIHLGHFETADAAARAYDVAAREHFGEFAALNFP